jgi:hypothetical protein
MNASMSAADVEHSLGDRGQNIERLKIVNARRRDTKIANPAITIPTATNI